MSGRTLQLFLFLLFMLMLNSHVSAYVPTMTCNEGSDPAVDPYACLEGDISLPISWSIVDELGQITPVSIFLNESGSDDIEMDEIEVALARSVAEWTTPSCTILEMEYGGLTAVEQIGYNFDNPEENINILYFYRENWPFQPGILALTATSYRNSTGEILDADIRVNDQYFSFSTADNPDEVIYDLRNALTHETGHMLGFDENPEHPESTMFPGSTSGELIKRDLNQDDIIAICDTYPAEDYTPSRSFLPSDPLEDENSSGCQQRRGHASTEAILMYMVMLLCGFYLRSGAYRRCRITHSTGEIKQSQNR